MTIEALLVLTFTVLTVVLFAIVLIRRAGRGSQPDIDELIRDLSRPRPEAALVQDAGPEGKRAGWRPVVAQRRGPPQEASDILMRIGDAFSPAAPIRRAELLKGRHREVETLIDIAFERGQHAIVFGERGVGKTSLANVAAEILSAGRHKLAAKVTCDATDTFDGLWRKALDELHLVQDLAGNLTDGRTSEAVSELAQIDEARPTDILRILMMITERIPCALIIDEFDRLADREARDGCSELLLEVSQRQLPLTLVILGVADTPLELIRRKAVEHSAAVTIRLDRLTTQDLTELLHDALGTVAMDIERTAAETIVALSGGLPHFTHLIGQMSARIALEAERRRIEMADVMAAIERYLEQTRDPISDEYQKAIASRHTRTYADVLLAAAITRTDGTGFFAAADIAGPLSEITGKNYTIPSFSRHLHALAEPERGPALLRKGYEHRHRFRFMEPTLRSFTLIKGLAEGAISVQQLRDASRESVPEDSRSVGTV